MVRLTRQFNWRAHRRGSNRLWGWDQLDTDLDGIGDACDKVSVPFIRGDANADGRVDFFCDAIYILGYIFLGGATPPCVSFTAEDGKGGQCVGSAVFCVPHD